MCRETWDVCSSFLHVPLGRTGVGSVLFIGSAVAKVPMERVVKAMLPFYLCMIAALLLITFIPQITLFLPGLFM